MVRIRLRRTGKKGQASYRVVVADSESPRDGRFIENIGFYNPRTDPPTIEIDGERARYWLSVGAQPSEPAARLLRKLGILDGGPDIQAAAKPAAEAAPVEEVEPEPEAKEAPEPEPEPEAEDEAVAEAAPEEEAEREPEAKEAPVEEADSAEEPAETE